MNTESPLPTGNAPEWSVSDLSGALKRTIEDNFGFVRVRGEISGYRGPVASGHVYFSLKDTNAKIDAVIQNARAALVQPEGLDALLWSFAPDPATARRRPETLADVPATSAESTAMAKALRKRGFRFVGPTTCYALMQAVGMVDDHLAGCSVPVSRSGRPAHA